MIDGSTAIEYVNGSVSTIPSTRPSPGMIDTAMPINRPMTSISMLYGTSTCMKPIERSWISAFT